MDQFFFSIEKISSTRIFFKINCHTHKIFKIFITDFFRKKISCNRSRIFTRNGWWYSQVPNRPREKDIDDFRFLSPVPTHGSQPMGMGPNPWAPTRGSQPMGPNPGPLGSQPDFNLGLNPDNSRAPTAGTNPRVPTPGYQPGRRLSAESDG